MRRETLARYGAPAAFLLAVTVAVLIVRASMPGEDRPPATQPPAASTTTAATPTTTGPAKPKGRFYRIESGDTLGDVAGKFDTSVERLLELNPLVEPTSLRVGQRIRVS